MHRVGVGTFVDIVKSLATRPTTQVTIESVGTGLDMAVEGKATTDFIEGLQVLSAMNLSSANAADSSYPQLRKPHIQPIRASALSSTHFSTQAARAVSRASLPA